MIFVEDSASPRTIPLDIDFAIVNPSPSVEANVQVPHEEVMAKFDCKVIVKDIFEENLTEKSKLLKANLDKNHSVASHRFSDKDFLEQSEKKEPIAWPKMSDDDSWSQLDSAVYSRLVGASSIQEKVELLENTIYHQATCIFGHPSRPNKSFRGLNRRARQSKRQVIERLGASNIHTKITLKIT